MVGKGYRLPVGEIFENSSRREGGRKQCPVQAGSLMVWKEVEEGKV